MSDPFGFFLLLSIGVLSVTMATIGIRRGRVVGLFNWGRDTSPGLFWYGVLFQLVLGAGCIFLAAMKAFG
jgi:hypothetical protein